MATLQSEPSVSATEDIEDEVSAPKRTKFSGASMYKTKFSNEWKKKWPFISSVPGDPHSFRCTLCSKNLRCGHQGAADVSHHVATKGHQQVAKGMSTQSKISFQPSMTTGDKIIRAEVKVANFMVEHTVPFAVADHFSPLVRDIFSDSDIAKGYHSCRTKTTSMVNMAIAPYFKANLTEKMKVSPYSLLVDGSNDTGLEKLNPLTVKIFDASANKVKTQLLDMCTTTGRNCGTSSEIFSKINSVLDQLSVPWSNCVGFGVDNTSVNVGLRHSIMTLVKQENENCYFMGCLCHLVHNVASHASEALQKACGFDIENLCVDVFYWFDKSTRRKGILREFCEFCDSDYREIVRYINVRWLSLEAAVTRILQMYESLKSYFRSEQESQARFARLQSMFENPMTEVYLLFYQSIFPTFTHLNLLLQREDPTIFLVADSIRSFYKKLLSKFVKLLAITSSSDLTEVDFANTSNQLDDSAITIGIITKRTLNKLFDDGDISNNDKMKFYRGVRAFYVDAAERSIAKLPFNDAVLNNAKFLNFEKRVECTFDCVEYFCDRYSNLLTFDPAMMDRLQEEFTSYQLLTDSSIPQSVRKDALVFEDTSTGVKHYRMDMIWGCLAGMKNYDSSKCFPLLSQIAKLILVIPHSNAGEERVFSLIKQNKTQSRSSLQANGTLSSIIQVTLANCNSCISWEPERDLLVSSKRATMDYNRMHKN